MIKRIIYLVIMIVVLLFITKTITAKNFSYIDKQRPNLNYQRKVNLFKEVSRLSSKFNIHEKYILSIMEVETDIYNIRSRVCKGQNGKIVELEKCKNDNKNLYHREISCGYMQIKPNTFEEVMGYSPKGKTQVQKCRSMIYDWRTTLKASVKYLNNLINEVGFANGIGSYNAGKKHGDRNIQYIREVLNESTEM